MRIEAGLGLLAVGQGWDLPNIPRLGQSLSGTNDETGSDGTTNGNHSDVSRLETAVQVAVVVVNGNAIGVNVDITGLVLGLAAILNVWASRAPVGGVCLAVCYGHVEQAMAMWIAEWESSVSHKWWRRAAPGLSEHKLEGVKLQGTADGSVKGRAGRLQIDAVPKRDGQREGSERPKR